MNVEVTKIDNGFILEYRRFVGHFKLYFKNEKQVGDKILELISEM